MAGVGKPIKWFFFDPFILNRANLNAEPRGKIKPINTHGMNSTTELKRQESDRLKPKRWYSVIFARPEVGPLGVMLLLFAMLGYFSIPQGEFSLNPFAGEGFNALGIRNNFRVISQLGIVALGAGMLRF